MSWTWISKDLSNGTCLRNNLKRVLWNENHNALLPKAVTMDIQKAV